MSTFTPCASESTCWASETAASSSHRSKTSDVSLLAAKMPSAPPPATRNSIGSSRRTVSWR